MDLYMRRLTAPRGRRQMAKVRVTLLSGKVTELYANPKKRVDELKTMAMAFDRKNDLVRLRHVWLKYKGQLLREEMQHLYHLLPADIADEEFEFSIVLRSDVGGYSRSAPPVLAQGSARSRRPPIKTLSRFGLPEKPSTAPADSKELNRKTECSQTGSRGGNNTKSSKARRKWHITTVGLSAAEAMVKINLVNAHARSGQSSPTDD